MQMLSSILCMFVKPGAGVKRCVLNEVLAAFQLAWLSQGSGLFASPLPCTEPGERGRRGGAGRGRRFLQSAGLHGRKRPAGPRWMRAFPRGPAPRGHCVRATRRPQAGAAPPRETRHASTGEFPASSGPRPAAASSPSSAVAPAAPPA